MGKEIEIRFELNNRLLLENWLNGNATHMGTSHQVDTYYDNSFHSFINDMEHIYKWLRIREENNRTTFNYKHWLPEGQIIRSYCDEFEVEVSSAQELKEILSNLGFSVFIVVDKYRNTWRYKDCEIAIDIVEMLGDYIEIEYKGETANIEDVNQYLFSILKEIKADVGEEDHGGYGFKLIKMNYKT